MTTARQDVESSNHSRGPLEQVDGWSIWPEVDGVQLATRDKPLSDQEVRALTITRTLYANDRETLLERIAKQNKLTADLAAGTEGHRG